MNRILILLFFLAGLNAYAQKQRELLGTDNGYVSFRSEAPQEIIHAYSRQLKGIIDPSKKTFAFRIPIRSFEGFNSPLQMEHFNEKYLESDQYPDAVFTGKIIEDFDLSKEGTYNIRAKGKFALHGVETERIIRSTVVVKNNQAEVNSNFTVMLNDHSIKVPKIVHEKVASEVAVEIKAVLKRKAN